MSYMKGMWVRLRTQYFRDAGTDDHIYVGVFGKGGGSEFPLDVHGFDDFEEGDEIKYWYGDVWEATALQGARQPFGAQGWNHPAIRRINLDKVDYVYLRKQSVHSRDDDDAWRMDHVEVRLYGEASPQKRTFRKVTDIWLANEHGHQVWLIERPD